MGQTGTGPSDKGPGKGTAVQLTEDELQLIEAYRRAKEFGHADIHVAVQEGSRVKLWLTEKRK